MIIIQSRPEMQFPSLENIKDRSTRDYLTALHKQLHQLSTNIFIDITNLRNVEVVDALPAASEEYRGRFLVLTNAGAEDTLHLCIKHSGTGVYSWKQITLT